MRISVEYGLVFCTVGLTYRGNASTVSRVLVDSGSASTIFNVDAVESLGIHAELDDELETIRGVGGREVVFIRVIDALCVDDRCADHFRAEFGAMEYGFELNGILGMDFLLPRKAIIDLGQMELRFG